MKEKTNIVKIEQIGKDNVVYTYEPDFIKTDLSQSVEDFSRLHEKSNSGFRIDEILSKQIGLSEVERLKTEKRIEDEVLVRGEQVQEEAYQKAYELGKIEGIENAFQERKVEIHEKIEALDEIIKSMQSALNNIVIQNESQIVKLVYEVAKKIAMFEIENRPEKLVDVLKKLVNEMQSDERLVIRLADEDEKMINEFHEKLTIDLNFLTRAKIESSSEISRGGCVLETNDASIQATITQRAEKAWSLLQEKIPVIKNENVTEIQDSVIEEKEVDVEEVETKEIDEGEDGES